MIPDGLKDHAFTKAVFDAVRPVLKVEYDYRQRQGRDAEYVPDEYEFYLMRVGNRLAAVLSHCEQLSHAILFMSNYRQTAAMGRTGITRTKHLRYNIETPGSPIFKAVQKKRCKALYRALTKSPTSPEYAVGAGSEPS